MSQTSSPTWTATRVQHLYRHKSDTYYARLSINGKQTWRSLKTKLLSVAKPRLAKLLEEERARQEAAGGKIIKGSLSVGEAMRTRLEEVDNDPSIKQRTREYYQFLHRCLNTSWPGLSGTDVRDITESDCEEWAGRYSKAVSATLYNNASAELRKVLEVAIGEGLRSTNPAAKLKRKSPRKKDLSSRLPSKAQFVAWTAEIRAGGSWFSQHSADLVEFLAFSGLRVSEVRWVEWRHCDFEGEELRVVGDPVDRTKNGEIRIVPMIPTLKKLLQRLRSERADEPVTTPVMVVNEAQKSMDRAGKIVGLQHITHHDLRHFFATVCIESGVDIPTVAKWLGHKDGGALAMKVYGHLRNEHSLESAKKVVFS